MKKITKILLVAISLALLCGAIAVIAFADNASGNANSEFKWQFTDSLSGDTVYTDDFATALENSSAGGTITLLSDVEIATTAKITISKNITVDLDGHTLYMSQGGKEYGFVPSAGVTVKFMDGTVVNSSGPDYSGYSNMKTQAIFVAIGANATVQLEDVNTYGYAITYSWGDPYTVTVDGGEHHVYTSYGDMTYAGWICGNDNIDATVENATIYLSHADARLVGFQNYKATGDTVKSTAKFDNCTIVGSSAEHNIIAGLNKYSTVSFTKSKIYGTIAPGSTSLDTSKYNANFSDTDKNPVAGAVTLGEGCMISSAIDNNIVAWADGTTVVDLEALDNTKTSVLNYNAPSGYYSYGDFEINPAALTVEYTLCDKSALNVYKVVYGSTVTYYDETASLKQIISDATAGSTIYLLADATVVTDRYENPNNAGEYIATNIAIGKKITFDLDGHKFTLVERAKNCGFYINTTSNVVFKNGTLETVGHSDYNSSGATFPLVFVNKNGANVEFRDVVFSGGSLIYSWGCNYNVTVNGGTYTMNKPMKDANTAGLIAGQHNVTATVNGATIYSEGRAVVGSSSYKAISGGVTPKSTFTFNDCNIFATSASTSIVGNANQYTHVYFNGCRILGSITPSLNSSDSGKATIAAAANFIIGEKTVFASASNLLQSATVGSGMLLQPIEESITVNLQVYDFDRKVDYLYANWYDESGEVLKSVKLDGTVTTLVGLAPNYEGAGGISNGWYTVGGYVANAWTDTKNGATEVDFSEISLDGLTESLSFYPLPDNSKITESLTVASYNLSTTGAIRNNLYLPVAPDNVDIVGVYVGTKQITGRRVLFYDYTNDPVYYDMYVVNEVGATEFTSTTEVTVKYIVEGNLLEHTFSLSPANYANIIYEDSLKIDGNAYAEAAYNVVADLVRYSYLLSEFTGNEDENLIALYDKMSELCTDLPSDNDLAGSTANASALSGAGSIAYEASSYEPRWKFVLNESAMITDVKITLEGYSNGVNADRTNFGTRTYGIESVTRNADGYITSAYSQNIPIYNVVQMYTITLTKADGSEISGTYDLKSYYTATGKNTAAASFLKSVFSLAASTTAYKYPGGKVTADDISDFWCCNHANAVKQENIVSYIYNFHPRYCAQCDSWLFYYEDYGAAADGVTDRTRATHVSGTNDYEAIYWTHANANEWKERTNLSGGKHVAVVGNSDPANAKYYYISLPEGRGIYAADKDRDGTPETTYLGQNLGTVTIATDTSWNGVNFIIDDDTICNASGCSCVNSTGFARAHTYKDQPIFTLDEYGAENYTESLVGKITSLHPGDTNIGYAPGRKMLINLVDSNRKIYYRYGSNASNGASVTEVILVDEFGNIDPSTPVQWDYDTLTTAMAYSVDTDPIKVSGLNGDVINATFETYVNNSMEISIPHYVSCARNITITRSNATVEGIERFFTEEAANSHVTNKRFAYTFIAVSKCSKATVKDMLVMNHNSQSGASGTSQGSYEFNGGNANAVSWINCVTKNMFSNSKSGALQAYPIYRGLFGTNHIRNMYLKGCYLNSFDAHTGAYNVTLEDTTVEHMNFIGGGLITIRDVIVYTASGGMAFNLRTDYGSTWHGDVDIDGLTIRYANASGYKPSVITIFKGSYENQYWGMDTYTPQNVTINDFHVQPYTATVSNGVRTETLGTIDTGITVYYYYALRSLKESDVPDVSAAGEHGPEDKGDSSIDYDYGTNHLEVTKNLTITNSVNIVLPTGSYWKNMTVTVDGKTKTWSGDEDTGTWS